MCKAWRQMRFWRAGHSRRLIRQERLGVGQAWHVAAQQAAPKTSLVEWAQQRVLFVQGMKPDEVLEVSLKLPFAPGAEANKDKSKEGNTQPGKQSQGTGGALLGKQRPGLGGLGTLLPRPRFTSPAAPLLAPQTPGLDGQSGSNANDGGHFVLRCGNLLMSAEVQLQSPCPACTQDAGWPGHLLPTDNLTPLIALWGRILYRNFGKDTGFWPLQNMDIFNRAGFWYK